MSDHDLHVRTLPKTNKPMRIAARQAHWLQVAFKSYLDVVGQDIGCEFTIDTAKLTSCFVQWLRAVARQNPKDRNVRQEYFNFSAGLMLRELMADMPASATCRPTKISDDNPASFWPEGVACTMFCLAVLYSIEEEEFKIKRTDSANINDLRFWWSFKENCKVDPNYAIAFFQKIYGIEPNWMVPSIFSNTKMALNVGL